MCSLLSRVSAPRTGWSDMDLPMTAPLFEDADVVEQLDGIASQVLSVLSDVSYQALSGSPAIISQDSSTEFYIGLSDSLNMPRLDSPLEIPYESTLLQHQTYVASCDTPVDLFYVRSPEDNDVDHIDLFADLDMCVLSKDAVESVLGYDSDVASGPSSPDSLDLEDFSDSESIVVESEETPVSTAAVTPRGRKRTSAVANAPSKRVAKMRKSDEAAKEESEEVEIEEHQQYSKEYLIHTISHALPANKLSGVSNIVGASVTPSTLADPSVLEVTISRLSPESLADLSLFVHNCVPETPTRRRGKYAQSNTRTRARRQKRLGGPRSSKTKKAAKEQANLFVMEQVVTLDADSAGEGEDEMVEID
eukprot:TRINITY_DN16753_c0_g1_i1.p1 TRINITY_DN16753_c0_g1~~TRINITY_DN16753_c0_g1_i1.p1  ORF type:complete len:363 (+),score=92.00 TRINITY_DN16753_c0_g1_i1:238-1326(+)